MSTTRRVPQHWLYRVGAIAIDVHHHRAIWSFTWLSTDPPLSDTNTVSALNTIGNSLTHPFGFANPISWSIAQVFNDQLYPTRRALSAFNIHAVSPTALMIPAAPELAFRLQRVGAVGGFRHCGRICFPIQSDSWLTDVPHRRHVDRTRFQPLFTATFPLTGNSLAAGGRTYQHVIYNRAKHTWVNVTHHVLEVSTVRIWQRARIYNPSAHSHPDNLFVPDEVHFPP